MSHIEPEEYARIGIYLLEESILEILMEGMIENERISNAKVSKRMEIYRGPSGSRDWISWTILNKLIEENRVIRPERGRYELSEQEFASRRDRQY